MIDTPNRHRAGRTLALVGIVLVAVNLCTAVAALSPIVTQVNALISCPHLLEDDLRTAR